MKGGIQKRTGKKGVSYRIYYDGLPGPDGERSRRFETVKGGKKEAETLLRQRLTQIDKGEFITPTKETVAVFLQRWLDSYAASRTSLRTQQSYQTIVRCYLVPQVGNIPLVALRPEHLQAMYAAIQEQGLSARTALHAHRVLHEALSHAVKWGILARNVCDAVDPPRPARKEMTTIDTDDKVRVFLSAIKGTEFGDVFFVSLYTGLRRSELLALRWDQIDLERERVHIVAGLHRIRGQGLVLLPTKTNRSRRPVSITQEVVDMLHKIRGRQMVQHLEAGDAWNMAGFVFADVLGNPLDPDRISKVFAKLRNGAGIPDVRLHDLRHTHASIMLKAGVHPKVVSERLGHATVSTTMDIYSHVLPGLQEDAAERFSQAISGRVPE